MYSATLEFDMLPKTVNILTACHWRVRSTEKRKWHKIIEEYVVLKKMLPPEPLAHAKLILTRYSSHTLDYDGLVGSFKYVIDALVEARVLEDDSMEHIDMPTFQWVKVAPKHGMIKVHIQEN